MYVCIILILITWERYMSTAIIYYSKHHGNTKKLLDAIAAKYEVTLIDVTAGGICKGHPDEGEVSGAVDFYGSICGV